MLFFFFFTEQTGRLHYYTVRLETCQYLAGLKAKLTTKDIFTRQFDLAFLNTLYGNDII